MPTDLTDADRAYLCSRIDESLRSENEYRSLIEDVYRAGLAAGRERAIEECAKLGETLTANHRDDPLANSHDGGIRRYAKAIMALK